MLLGRSRVEVEKGGVVEADEMEEEGVGLKWWKRRGGQEGV